MTPIPKSLRLRLENLPRMHQCERRSEGECGGVLTWEHAFGRKYQAEWNIICLCSYHHLGAGLNKELNHHIAYSYCSDADLRQFKCYKQMKQEKSFLTKKYGKENDL